MKNLFAFSVCPLILLNSISLYEEALVASHSGFVSAVSVSDEISPPRLDDVTELITDTEADPGGLELKEMLLNFAK